jgi:bifunctional non-homologous end joining protein LigD
MPTRRSEPADALSAYRRKRDFERTPEPRATAAKRTKQRSFVIQKHAASRLHYDFRLEFGRRLVVVGRAEGAELRPGRKAHGRPR